MTKREQLVLVLLQDHGELRGVDFVKLSEGRLKSGLIYVLLGRMVDKGLIKVSINHTSRNTYLLSEHGLDVLGVCQRQTLRNAIAEAFVA